MNLSFDLEARLGVALAVARSGAARATSRAWQKGRALWSLAVMCAAGLGVLAAGCSLAPEFTRPALPVADEYPTDAPMPTVAKPDAPTAAETAQKRQRVLDEASREPAVQEALDLFNGKVVDVRGKA